MGVFTSKALPSGCKELSSGNLSQPIRDEQNMKFHVQVFPSAVGLIDRLSALPSRFFHFRNELNDTESTEVTRIFTLHFPTLPMPINRSYPPDMDAGAVWLPKNTANFSWSTSIVVDQDSNLVRKRSGNLPVIVTIMFCTLTLIHSTQSA